VPLRATLSDGLPLSSGVANFFKNFVDLTYYIASLMPYIAKLIQK